MSSPQQLADISNISFEKWRWDLIFYSFKEQCCKIVFLWTCASSENWVYPTMNCIISLCTHNKLGRTLILYVTKWIGYLHYLCLLVVTVKWDRILSIVEEFLLDILFIMAFIWKFLCMSYFINRINSRGNIFTRLWLSSLGFGLGLLSTFLTASNGLSSGSERKGMK